MRRFVFGFVFLCCAFWNQAQAMVPLEIKATLQLPNTAVWDIQHCADDTSFGYAYVVGDTICWANRIGEPLRRYAIPVDSILPSYDPWCELWGPIFSPISLAKLSSRNGHLCAVLTGHLEVWNGMEQSNNVGDYVVYIDLEDQMLISRVHINGGSTFPGGGEHNIASGFYQILSWPPLPSTAISIFFMYRLHGYGGQGGNIYNNLVNRIYSTGMPIQTNIFQRCQGDRMIPFADFDAALFMIGDDGLNCRCWGGRDPDTCIGEHWSSLSQYNLLTNQLWNLGSCDVSWYQQCTRFQQIPQHDIGGTNRLITPGAYAVSATQLSDTLWHNAALVGSLYTAKLMGEGDEQVMGYDAATGKFGIFNGGTGALMDCTSAIQGAIAYLIKQPNRFDEIVTKDATNLVRVYGTTPNPPSALLNVVCKYLPADSSIQVCWSPVFRASSYYIFSRPFCSEDFEAYLGEVADTTFTIPISNSRECFRVSAVAQ